MTFLTNLKIYFFITFRNMFLFIAQYLVPLFFYLIFSAVLIRISPDNANSLIMSMTCFAVVMSCYIGLPGSVVTYSTGDICRAYIAGGIKLWRVFASIAVSGILHAFAVSTIILVTAPVIFKAEYPDNILEYLLVLLFVIFTATLIGLFVGMCSKSESIATIISQLMFLPSIFLSGIMMPVSLLPELLQKLSKLLPATHTFLMLQLNDYRSSLLYLTAFSAVLLLLIAVRYKNIVRAK